MNRKRFLQAVAAAVAVPARGRAQDQPVAAAPAPPPAAGEGAWTMVVLPDTQYYSQSFPDVFLRQTQWIVRERERLNIRFVAHVGDIVNENTHPEWQRARAALEPLVAARVPFSLLPGNHDLGRWGSADSRASLLSDYFCSGDFRAAEGIGYFERGRLDNTWHRLATPTGRWLVLALEFGPRDAVVEWAARIVAANSDRQVVLVTHAHLFNDGTRYDWATKGRAQTWNPKSYPVGESPDGTNDGEDLWRKLIAPAANIRFVLSGHVLGRGVARLTSEGAHGQRVHQLLANYQTGVKPARPPGGGGYLRLMQFAADGKSVGVSTYSPWDDAWLEDDDNRFTLPL